LYLFLINIYRVDKHKLLYEYGHEQVKLRKKKRNNKEIFIENIYNVCEQKV